MRESGHRRLLKSKFFSNLLSLGAGAPRPHIEGMFRKDLIGLLRAAPRSVADLALMLELEPREVEDDLRHLLKSLKHGGYRVTITPARCRHCDFRFHPDRLGKPGKCPLCRHTWIEPPRVQLQGPEES
jgi:predicted Zn-ribbon and HTH transcriptional regulator